MSTKRTARLASIIPLIRGDYVPQPFVEVDQDAYLEATVAVYELNEVGPLADLYAWSYRRSCQRYDTTVQVGQGSMKDCGALPPVTTRLGGLTWCARKCHPTRWPRWINVRMPPNVEPQHLEIVCLKTCWRSSENLERLAYRGIVQESHGRSSDRHGNVDEKLRPG